MRGRGEHQLAHHRPLGYQKRKEKIRSNAGGNNKEGETKKEQQDVASSKQIFSFLSFLRVPSSSIGMMGTLRGGQLTTDPSPSNETLVQGARPLPKRDDDWETEVEEMGAVPATNSKLKDPTATAQTVQQQEHFNSSQLNPQRPAVNITPLGKSPLGTPRSRTASLLTSTLRKFDPNAPNLQIGRDKMSLLARRFEEDGTKDSSQTERSESNALPGQEGKLKHPVGQDCKNGHGQKRKHPTILKDKDHKEEQGIGASEHKKKKKKSKINRSGSPAASSADSEKKPEKPEGGFTFMQGAYYILKREHRFMTAKEIVAIGMKEGELPARS